MRLELQKEEASVYSLSEMDLHRSIELADALVRSHRFRTEVQLADSRSDSSDAAGEVISDRMHYAHLEMSYVWGYTLWRMQAVFEGIISQAFLRSPGNGGFNAKLRKMKELGHLLTEQDENELKRWARFRNRLSHRPEWYYHAVWITREDVEEYLALLLRVLENWNGGAEFPAYAPGYNET